MMDSHDKELLDTLTASFYSVFCNKNGLRPTVDKLRELLIRQSVIIKNCSPATEIYDLEQFITPRQRILTDGTLTEFEEHEESEKTEIAGRIAHRLSHYSKSGVLSGKPFETRGVKTLQFVKTAEGWKISSVAWDDEVVP